MVAITHGTYLFVLLWRRDSTRLFAVGPRERSLRLVSSS